MRETALHYALSIQGRLRLGIERRSIRTRSIARGGRLQYPMHRIMGWASTVPDQVAERLHMSELATEYGSDEVISPTITIKVTGHQWYWSFEYSDYVTESGDPIEFDSYMIPESDLEIGQFRLLDVDNRVVVPVDTHIRLIVTGKTFCPY